MRAAWYERKGPAQDVIRFGEMETPPIGPGEVRVRVYVSGVNPSDTKGRSGFGGNMQMEYPRIVPHQDGAGVIESVGEGVPAARIGERVWLYEAQRNQPFGSAAEYVVVPSKKAVRLPKTTDFAQGACLGVPAMTAHRCVFGDGPVMGQTLLVTGGAGGVGYYAVQLAKWGGATVISTVSSPVQAEFVRAAGADYVINYKTEDVAARIKEITQTEDGRGIDRIIEVNFGSNLAINNAVLKQNGVISTYASGERSDVQPPLPFYQMLLSGGTIHLVFVYLMPEAAHQAAITDITTCLEAGALHHNIARCFGLKEVAAAHDAIDSGKAGGKVVVEVA